jgi:hypothetical protein
VSASANEAAGRSRPAPPNSEARPDGETQPLSCCPFPKAFRLRPTGPYPAWSTPPRSDCT